MEYRGSNMQTKFDPFNGDEPIDFDKDEPDLRYVPSEPMANSEVDDPTASRSGRRHEFIVHPKSLEGAVTLFPGLYPIKFEVRYTWGGYTSRRIDQATESEHISISHRVSHPQMILPPDCQNATRSVDSRDPSLYDCFVLVS
ncbi:hypothetical protein RJT34_00745 [Clitoria ternatea]|uniref:Uncharacterized protein n=1 Tax=Clitoria ternatea TaxID=43366 RepID=A0AAN9PY77_CLITE